MRWQWQQHVTPAGQSDVTVEEGVVRQVDLFLAALAEKLRYIVAAVDEGSGLRSGLG